MQVSVKEERERFIGGSDIPIIMGISPFKTRFDLLLSKAQLREETFTGNDFTEYGNEMEANIRNYVNLIRQTNFVEGKHIVGEDIRCHTDGENEDTILEIKTTSQIHDNVNDYKHYLVQLLFYMENTNRRKGILAVYHRPEDFSLEFDHQRLQIFDIKIEDYKELLEDINLAVAQFRYDLARIKQDPFLSEEDLLPLDLKELSRQVIAIENRLIEYKKLEEEEKELKAKLKEAMEKSGKTGWETPNGVKITLVPNGEDKIVKKFNESKFRLEHEKTWDKYCDDVIQKGKTGYIRITTPKEK